MKRILPLAIIGLLIAGTATGLSINEIPIEPTDEEIQQYVEEYNNNTEEVPGIVRNIIGDQNINLHYENNTYGAEMDNMEIKNVTESFDQPSLEVWIEKQDILEVANSSQPKEKLKEKLNEGEIKYQEHGLVNKVTFGAIRTANKIGLF